MNNDLTALLELRHVEICYGNKPVVADVNLTVAPGEILCIVGESGSGKSSLLKACMNILNDAGSVTKGDIFFDGVNLLDTPPDKLRQIYGTKLNMIWQNAGASLCPIRTVGTQLVEYVNQHQQMDKNTVFATAAQLFAKMHLPDSEALLNSYPFELSGGMNQRVGIVFAMMLKPQLLFADEPTSALDVTVQAQVLRELLLMRRLFNTSIVMVTHNIAVARRIADKIAVMHHGKIVEYSDAQQVIANPQTAYTQQLLDSVLYLKRG